MKQLLKRRTQQLFDLLADRVAQQLADPLSKADRVAQIQLVLQYQALLQNQAPLPSFADVEFSATSQNGEDGILLFLFTVIGTINKRVVEICAGDGIECNAANLILNHGWEGLLFDGKETAVKRGQTFYQQRTNAWRLRRLPPKLVHAWIEPATINELVAQHGMTGPIDLLSLDMDGVDYWVWQALEVVQSRLVVLEYNNRWPADRSVTVPNSKDFVAIEADTEGEGYFGASLAAFNKLARQKGYRLIGANSPNTNAFFLQNGIADDLFPEVSVASCLSSDYARYHQARKVAMGGDKRPLIEI